jgi:hypothetical protein
VIAWIVAFAALCGSTVLPGDASAYLVSFRVVDGSDAPVPAKLLVLGLDESGKINLDLSPSFDRLDFDPVAGREWAGSRYAILAPVGTATAALDSGRYLVLATRGIEYSIAGDTLRLPEMSDTTLQFRLEHLVDVPGRISADFHVHSYASNDSRTVSRTHGWTYAFPDNRILDFLTSGVELIVACDHQRMSDYAPVIQEVDGLLATEAGVPAGFIREKIASIIGDELALYIEPPGSPPDCPPPGAPPTGRIHVNVWPLQEGPSPKRCSGGVTLQPATLYDIMRGIDPPPDETPEQIQLNHPRGAHYELEGQPFSGGRHLGYFYNFGYDPYSPIPPFDDGGVNSFLRIESDSSATQNIDFDVLEILNRNYIPYYVDSRTDWFSFLNQGFRKVATGNTDAHLIFLDGAGYPRNYVASALSDMAGFGPAQEAAILDSLGSGDVFSTTGPIIDFNVDGVGMGDSLIVAPQTPVTISVTVRAAPWIPVGEVRMIVNGVGTFAWNVAGSNPVDPFSTDPADCLRFSKVFTVPFVEDAWVIFEAGIKIPMPGVQPPSSGLFRYITSEHLPIAFTNPVFVRVEPPGGPAL